MSLTDLDRALEAYRAAERGMGAERRKDNKGLPADKAAAAAEKRQAAEQVRNTATSLSRENLSGRQRRDVKRALDYLRLTAKPKDQGDGSTPQTD